MQSSKSAFPSFKSRGSQSSSRSSPHRRTSRYVYGFTLFAVFFELIILSLYVVFLYIGLPDENYGKYISPYQFRLFLHAVLFFFVELVYRFADYYSSNARRVGHIDYYESTRHLVGSSRFIWGCGSALALALFSIYPTNDYRWRQFRPIHVLQGIAAFEWLCIALLRLILSIYVLRFTLSRRALKHSTHSISPELYLDEGAALSRFTELEETRVADDVELTQLIDRQMELIRFLKSQRLNLSRQVLELTHNLAQAEGGAGADAIAELETRRREAASLREERNDLEAQVLDLRAQLMRAMRSSPPVNVANAREKDSGSLGEIFAEREAEVARKRCEEAEGRLRQIEREKTELEKKVCQLELQLEIEEHKLSLRK